VPLLRHPRLAQDALQEGALAAWRLLSARFDGRDGGGTMSKGGGRHERRAGTVVRTVEALGTWDEVVTGHDLGIAALMTRLRGLIVALDPDVVEVPRRGDRAITYGVGEKKMSEGYVYLAPQRDWVNLGFFHATSLPDPAGVLEGTGVRMRHVKVRPGDVREDVLRALLVEARRERAAALGR
jgi:hypothetical protein